MGRALRVPPAGAGVPTASDEPLRCFWPPGRGDAGREQDCRGPSQDVPTNEPIWDRHPSRNLYIPGQFHLISATNTSLHYVLTFPDNLTSDETITIKPNQRYRPTPAELQKPSRSGIRMFSPTLTVNRPKEALFTLHYFALQSSLPTEVQQWIQKISATSPLSGTHSLSPLVPSVWAQEGGGNGEGGGLGEAVATEVIQTSDVQMLENFKLKDMGKLLEALATVVEMIKSYDKMKGWMDEMKELEDCAKDPTNPLAVKASKNPEYQKEVLDPLDSASLDVQSAAFPILSNLTASALPQFAGGSFPVWELPFRPLFTRTMRLSTKSSRTGLMMRGRTSCRARTRRRENGSP